MTRLPWRKNINKKKKENKSNLQVKLNQVVVETKPRRRIHRDWLIWRAKASAYLINWYWLVLDTSSHSFTTKKNLLAFRRNPGSHRCSGSTRGEKLTFLFFAPRRGGVKRELWVMEDLSANLKKTVDNETSLLPKTQSSAWENMATSEVKLSDSKKLRIYMHANQNHPICF